MAKGINKVIIVGHLGQDPEFKSMPSGTGVANISVATTEQWKDKGTGEKQSKTEWHRIVFFGRLAEVVSQYLKKGAQVYVEGRLQTDKYTDKQGVERYTTKIIASEMQMLGSKGERSSAPDDAGTSTGGGDNAAGGMMDDDIPFDKLNGLYA